MGCRSVLGQRYVNPTSSAGSCLSGGLNLKDKSASLIKPD